MFSDYYMKVIKSINDGLSCNEICTSLNISRKQLYSLLLYLKNDGINYTRRYQADGVLYYEPVKKLRDTNESNSVTLHTQYGGKEQRVLVISDLHFGNSKERLDLIERAYNFCLKNDIHVILIAGDLLDGTYTKGIKERREEEVYEQVRHFVRDYPFDDKIINIATLGDHDYSILTTNQINLKDVIGNKRHDICIGGYNNTTVNIKNDNIMLYHHLNCGSITSGYTPIILKGHGHNYSSIKRDDGVLDISVPALSSVMDEHPSALILDMIFKDGYICEADVKQVLFLDKDYVVSNNRYEFKNSREKINPVKNEVDFVEERDLFDFVAGEIIPEDVSEEALSGLKLKFKNTSLLGANNDKKHS